MTTIPSILTLSIDALPVASGDATIPTDTGRALPLSVLLTLDEETARVVCDVAYAMAADIRRARVRAGLDAWA